METYELSEKEYKEFLELLDRQARLEEEMQNFKMEVEQEIQSLRSNITDSHRLTYDKVQEVARRMDNYEREIQDVKSRIESLSVNVKEKMDTMDTTLTSINTMMSSMSNSQAELIKVQNNTIRSLWKAFFAVLGIITTAGGLLVAYFGG